MRAKVDVHLLPGQGPARRPVQEVVKAVLAAEGASGSVAVAFVDEAEIRGLNERFRGLDEPTDVLSFRQADSDTAWPDPRGAEDSELGEVVVCPAVVRRYATSEGGDPATQMGWTLVHGVLHLLDYDHETDDGEMRAREQQLLRELAPQVGAVSRAFGE